MKISKLAYATLVAAAFVSQPFIASTSFAYKAPTPELKATATATAMVYRPERWVTVVRGHR